MKALSFLVVFCF